MPFPRPCAYAPYSSLIHALPACLHPYAPCPSLISTCAPMHLRVFPRLCTFTLTNKHLTCLFFVLCCIVSIVRNSLTLKNPSKATGPDFIPLNLSNLLQMLLILTSVTYIIKDLEKNKYSKSQKQFNYWVLNNSIIISSVDSVTLLGIVIDIKLNVEKYAATVISFYIFLSRQHSLLQGSK